MAAEATREQQTPVAYLAALLEAEMAERAERREKRRLIDARFPLIKRLEDFRFADNPKVPQATIAALAEGSWIDDRDIVILIGDSGTGKTHLATALAVCACQQGRRVRFTTLAALANELQEADSRKELARVVGRYARTELVCLDELGYLTLPDGAAELVFQVITERHERGIADRDHQPAHSAKRTGSSEGVGCRLQRSHVRERGGFGVDGADQVVQRSFGCHPEGGGDEARVEAVGELGQARSGAAGSG